MRRTICSPSVPIRWPKPLGASDVENGDMSAHCSGSADRSRRRFEKFGGKHGRPGKAANPGSYVGRSREDAVGENTRPQPDHTVEFTFGGTHVEPRISAHVSNDALRNCEKWTRFPLSAPATDTPQGVRIEDLFDIRRGIATGNNKVFILSPERVTEMKLPKSQLTPLLSRSPVFGYGLRGRGCRWVSSDSPCRLFDQLSIGRRTPPLTPSDPVCVLGIA